MLASAAAMSSPALAVGTPQYGSVKLQWNVSTALTAVIHTNYTATFTSAGTSPTLLSSGTGGACTATGVSTDLTIDFGTITPSLSNPVACLYKNSVEASVTDNDANGVLVYQALDAALPAGLNLCAFPNVSAAFPVAASTTVSQQSSLATGPAPSTTCATAPGALVPVAAGGAVTGTAGSSSVVGGTGETYQNGTSPYSIGGHNWMKEAAGHTAGTSYYGGEDLQLNVAQTASSGASSAIMTIQFIPQ